MPPPPVGVSTDDTGTRSISLNLALAYHHPKRPRSRGRSTRKRAIHRNFGMGMNQSRRRRRRWARRGRTAAPAAPAVEVAAGRGSGRGAGGELDGDRRDRAGHDRGAVGARSAVRARCFRCRRHGAAVPCRRRRRPRTSASVGASAGRSGAVGTGTNARRWASQTTGSSPWSGTSKADRGSGTVVGNARRTPRRRTRWADVGRRRAPKRSTSGSQRRCRWFCMAEEPRTSRAIVRNIEAGSMVLCAHCEAQVKFRARVRAQQVICNVYDEGRWLRVEHFHVDCYEAAASPTARPTSASPCAPGSGRPAPPRKPATRAPGRPWPPGHRRRGAAPAPGPRAPRRGRRCR